ncbi:aminotransferase class I/II-fold pyridoxal phosphate-dependent enzyme [Novosphingobium sediminicola]|uniref:Glycine C-acetyltransferase/8-amino-7-oxononanoate synthase n=1 Tax=Novosphingobium sediminicola TaxID=563162 RepID=A0A7W6CNV4_9SPHN|nr:glycine C-acetyltransferase/8-amino-7-oxononanoate synthase [Novosphingobium sediminicola]
MLDLDLPPSTDFSDLPLLAVGKSAAHFARPRGADLLGRTSQLFAWTKARSQHHLWPYVRSLECAPGETTSVRLETGELCEGINLASQDYLGLSSHPSVHAAAKHAIEQFGVHSAGSGALVGNTAESLCLERELGEALQAAHVLLFPTGWAAGFGTVVALVRSYDHIVMDELAHACLQQGANAATKNITRVRHLDAEAFREALSTIRASDTQNGILVITEGVYSMDADTPNISALQELCDEYGATLMVDVAHDFGSMGPGGLSQIAAQSMLGKVDIVMGSFSKTFASNGGFVAVKDASVRRFIQIYGGPWIFSNALSPIQAAIVRQALRIVRSDEGDILRGQLMTAIKAFRDEVTSQGEACFGNPTPIIPMLVGQELVGRIGSQLAFDRGVIVNLAEFPVVPVGASRFRIQMMASHSEEAAREGARRVVAALTAAREIAQ